MERHSYMSAVRLKIWRSVLALADQVCFTQLGIDVVAL